MTSQDLTKIVWHLEAALVLLKKGDAKAGGSTRDPAHFTSGGRLTREGEDHLYSLFEAGKNPTEAAKLMGIHPSASWARQQTWLKLKAKKRS